MIDVWTGMKIGGLAIGAIGGIGGTIANQRRQEEKFESMLGECKEAIYDKFDLNSKDNEETPQ